jgi:uncharacterized membrane protein YphA (DoxX/SURF4 family)
MRILVVAVTLLMASTLLWAGLEKARSLRSVARTLHRLGMPESGSRLVAPLVVAVELGVALGLIYRPRSIVTLTGVLALATAFAISGFMALRRKEKIRCGCFGPHGGAHLGWNQLASLPVWFSAVALVWLNGPTHSSDDGQGASGLAVVALLMAVLRGVSSLRAAHEARGDRRSAQEMFVWLNR